MPIGVEDMESENQNSSAYSSLTNSTNEISEAMTVVGSGGSSPVSDVVIRRPASTNPRNGTTSIEIRTIIDDYNATLKRATKEIKALTVEKKKLEKEYEKLLTINETLATDLEKTLR